MLQPKSIWSAVLSTSNGLYNFDVTTFHNFFLIFGYFLKIWDPFEVLSHFSIISSSKALSEDLQLIID